MLSCACWIVKYGGVITGKAVRSPYRLGPIFKRWTNFIDNFSLTRVLSGGYCESGEEQELRVLHPGIHLRDLLHGRLVLVGTHLHS